MSEIEAYMRDCQQLMTAMLQAAERLSSFSMDYILPNAEKDDGTDIETTVVGSALPVMPGMTSPEGFPLAYTAAGELVHWVRCGQTSRYTPFVIFRGRERVTEAYSYFYKVVWWNRRQAALAEELVRHTETQDQYCNQVRCQLIEQEIGVENLRRYDLLESQGILRALAWVIGHDWEEGALT